MEKLKIIFDTDVYNEIDDQFAICYLLANKSIFDIQAITISPYCVAHQQDITVSDGMELSYRETKNIFRIMKKSVPLYKGSVGFMQQGYEESNIAVKKIIEISRKNDFTYIIAVGSVTNVALALKFASDINEKISVVWLGTGHFLKDNFTDTNFVADPKAVDFILHNCRNLTIVPTTISRSMRLSVYEMENKLIQSELKDYLIERTKWFYYYKLNGESITIHDVVPLDLFVNPQNYLCKNIDRPVLNNNNGFEFGKSKLKLNYVIEIDQYRAVRAFFDCINDYIKKNKC